MSKELDIVYLAKPRYGGWATFIVYLMHSLREHDWDVRLFRVTKTNEGKDRDFGYGITYQNINTDSFEELRNPFIAAVDKHHVDALAEFCRPEMPDAKVVIHDPNDLKNGVHTYLYNFDVVVLRKTMQVYLEEHCGIDAAWRRQPFYRYPVEWKTPEEDKKGAVATSRIDFDKYTHLIVQANKMLEDKGIDPVALWGKYSRPYVFHTLDKLDIDWRKFYKGAYDQSFEAVHDIFDPVKFLVDMSVIVGDGSGTQATFLEAIHSGVTCILNTGWFTEGIEVLEPDKNCLAVKDEKELADLIESDPDVSKINREAEKIFDLHVWKDIP